MNKQAINLVINVEKPPLDVLYGLQSGSGHDYGVSQKQRTDGSDLSFKLEAEIRFTDSDTFDFFGPSIQGPKGGRFIYLNIGTSAGDHFSPWSRRLKVPLVKIPSMPGDFGSGRYTLTTTVPGTAKDGSPTCATVKPFAGWEWV